MSMNASPQDIEEKKRLFIERARQGVLKFLAEKGSVVSMADLHDFTLQKFFIQHQGFSNLMEGLVGDHLVEFSHESSGFFLTEKGRTLASQS